MVLFVVVVVFIVPCTSEPSHLSTCNLNSLPGVIVGVGVAIVDSVLMEKGVTTIDVLAKNSRLLVDGWGVLPFASVENEKNSQNTL